MSLVHKSESTEAKVEASRSNGRRSRGPVTPEGKARFVAAHLRHGHYSKSANQALPGLGENPKDYTELMESLQNDPAAVLERELLQFMGYSLWKMRRAQNVQKSLAAQRVNKANDKNGTAKGYATLLACDQVIAYEELATALDRPSGPTSAEIQAFVSAVGDNPAPEQQELLVLLCALAKPQKGAGTAAENAGAAERTEDPAWEAARLRAQARARALEAASRETVQRFQREDEEDEAAQRLMAMVDPEDQKSRLMRRDEESNLRQVWRLTNLLCRVRRGQLTPRDVKNEGLTPDVYENNGDTKNHSED